MPTKKPFNPFYALLIPAGLVFVVTSFAYGYMAFQAVNSVRAEAGRHATHPLFQWLRTNGDMAMLVELAVLAVLTVGAIGTDRYWDRSRSDSEEFDRLRRGKMNH
jgi:hypothetical protein